MGTRYAPRRLNLDDLSDLERAAVARFAFLTAISGCARFQQAVRDWIRSDDGRRCLDTIATDHPLTPGPDWWAQFRAPLGLQLQPLAAPLEAKWLRDYLADLALLMAVQAEAKWESLTAQLELRGTVQRSRRLKGGGASLERDVQWFFDAKVRRPAIAVKTLANRYAAETQRHGDARSVVQDGIKRAHTILSIDDDATV